LSRLLALALGLGSVVAIITTSGALAAYGSPRVEATQSGNTITIDLEQNASDDATALVRLITLPGSAIPDRRQAGTVIGTASATFVATAAGDSEL
jgi:hypothetical protein